MYLPMYHGAFSPRAAYSPVPSVAKIFPKGSMYLHGIYLGPKATIQEPLYGPSTYYIGTWILWVQKPLD